MAEINGEKVAQFLLNEKEKRKRWKETHKEQRSDYNRKWRQSHKLHIKEYAEKWRKDHKDEIRLKVKSNEEKLRENLEKYLVIKNRRRNSNKITRQNQKFSIMAIYSEGQPKCICCEEMELDFLSIDHINGGGTKFRKEFGMHGYPFYLWLERNNFPEEYQVLCMNCQFGRKCNNGVCPHIKGD